PWTGSVAQYMPKHDGALRYAPCTKRTHVILSECVDDRPAELRCRIRDRAEEKRDHWQHKRPRPPLHVGGERHVSGCRVIRDRDRERENQDNRDDERRDSRTDDG